MVDRVANSSVWRGRSQRRFQRGFTLLEIVLSLALAVLLIALVNMAVGIFLRTSQASRYQVDEAELAGNLLSQIAADLRSAVIRAATDTEAVEQLAAIMSADELSQRELDDLAQGTGNQSSSDDEVSEPSESKPASPGLYGDAYQLQVDVGRFPALAELMATGTGAAPPAGIQTVSYFVVQPGESAGGLSAAAAPIASGEGGLVRRALDRAVANWAAASGDFERLERSQRRLASHVTGIEFRYYDGTEWCPSWDSEERQGLPLAVEVTLSMMPQSTPAGEDAQPLVFRLLVDLPAARANKLVPAGTQEQQESE